MIHNLWCPVAQEALSGVRVNRFEQLARQQPPVPGGRGERGTRGQQARDEVHGAGELQRLPHPPVTELPSLGTPGLREEAPKCAPCDISAQQV